MKKLLLFLLFPIAVSAQINISQSNNGSFLITPKGVSTYPISSTPNDTSNISLGSNALKNNTTGMNNIAIGRSALRKMVGTYQYDYNTNNVAIGMESMQDLRPTNIYEGVSNTALGSYTMRSNLSGSNNTALGYYSMYFPLSSNYNTAVGAFSIANTYTTGNENSAVGYNAMNSRNGGENAVLGAYTLMSGYGSRNTAIGTRSLVWQNNGSRNTAIGYEAGAGVSIDTSPDSANVFIGYQAGKLEGGSNKLYISNSDTQNPLIWGDFYNQHVGINGRLGIGTQAPATKLHMVDGAFRITNTADSKNWDFAYDANNNYFYIDEFGIGRRLFLKNGGNVGINTNPGATLDIFGPNSYADIQLRNSTSNVGLQFYIDNNRSFIDYTQGGYFELKTLGKNRFSVGSDGRVGINSSSISSLYYALEVYDSYSTTTNMGVLFAPNVWSANSSARLNFGDQFHFVKATNSVGMEIYDYNKIKLTGGNVGIGTSDPDTKLEVDGFTKLGNDAPKIKMKEFYHININPQPLRTATSEGGTISYDLGISSTKILAVNIFVDYGSIPFTNTSSDRFVPPSYTHTNGYQFDYYLEGNNIYVRNHPTNSENILDKYIKILVTYKE